MSVGCQALHSLLQCFTNALQPPRSPTKTKPSQSSLFPNVVLPDIPAPKLRLTGGQQGIREHSVWGLYRHYFPCFPSQNQEETVSKLIPACKPGPKSTLACIPKIEHATFRSQHDFRINPFYIVETPVSGT